MTEDLEALVALGKRLDWEPDDLCDRVQIGWLEQPDGKSHATVRDFLGRALLKIRDKQGSRLPLAPNRAQREFSRRCGRRNIVLKARQVGVTTWVAARFFLHTITRPGTVSVQVTHDMASAEELFRIVRRFLENLPERLRQGALETSRANVRQIIFPHLDSEYRVETAADPNAGRGLTIRNLHCSEVARWPRDPAETLASLRAAVPPDGEIVLEAALESAWGTSGLARMANNYFGIKARPGGEAIELPTIEYVNGAPVRVTAKFAQYASIAECFADRDHMITSLPAYQEARAAAADPEAFARALARHWATDPGYAEKVLTVYRVHGLDRLDLRPTETPGS